MTKSILVVWLTLLIGAPFAMGDDHTKSQLDPESALTAEISRLRNPEQAQHTAAVTALKKRGKPALPPLVKLLSDSTNDVRARAAEVIRFQLAADFTSAPNYHDRSYWEERSARVKVGMSREEAYATLGMPGKIPAHFEWASATVSPDYYRLDDYWIVWVPLSAKKQTSPAAKVFQVAAACKLEPETLWVNVKAPLDFTGTWATWYVNGQKVCEIQYRDGKYDGKYSRYHDNGVKAVEQSFPNGEANGTDKGWFRSGLRHYEGQYRNGKMDGVWRWYNGQGDVHSEATFRDGKRL